MDTRGPQALDKSRYCAIILRMKNPLLLAALTVLAAGLNPVSAEEPAVNFQGAEYESISNGLPVPEVSSAIPPSGGSRGKFLIIGHAGSPKKEPENTLEGFTQALKDGANGLEMDVSITKDNVLVLWHDWNPNSLIAFARAAELQGFKYIPHFGLSWHKKHVNELTLEELREEYGYELPGFSTWHDKSPHKIPSLEEFAAWAAGRKGIDLIYLDIKIPADMEDYIPFFVKEIWRITEKHGISDKTVFFTPHVNLAILASQFAKKNSIGLKIGLDRELPASLTMEPVGDDAKNTPINVPDFAPTQDASTLNLKYSSVGRPTGVTLAGAWKTFTRIIKYALKPVRRLTPNPLLIAWTINDMDEMLWLYNAGVSGVVTDVPDQVAGKLQEAGLLK